MTNHIDTTDPTMHELDHEWNFSFPAAELIIDTRRGVIYLNDKGSGITLVRIGGLGKTRTPESIKFMTRRKGDKIQQVDIGLSEELVIIGILEL